MKLFLSVRSLLAFVFRRSRTEREMEEELRTHLRSRADDLERQGLPRAEAERRARIEFGGYERFKEECREALGSRLLGELIADVRYGLRQIRRAPLFTAVAAITMALGIGATTAIFSIVHAVLLHGAPYRDPARLVEMVGKSTQREEEPISTGDFSEWPPQSNLFDGLAAYRRWEFRVLTGAGEPDSVWVSPVSTNTFRLLGVNPAMGRGFAAGETETVVLSHRYWRSRFGGDPSVIGKTVALDGKPYTLIGVAPSDFEFPDPNTQLWVPLTFTATEKNNHELRVLDVIARLQAGVNLKQAQAAMDVTAHELASRYPKTDAGWSIPVRAYKGRGISKPLRSAVLALAVAVIFVLLIVSANVTSMLLARGATRQAEMAVRAALGAGRWRLVRQLVVEAALLAVAGNIAGLLLASWSLTAIVSLLPKFSLIETQAVHRISINFPVLAFAVVLSLATGIVVGLLPALRVSALNLNDSLKQRGQTSAAGAGGSRVQSALIVCEVALGLVLLVGAGLMIQSFERLQSAPTGFNPDRVLTVRIPLVNYKYSQAQSPAFYTTVLERIRAISGVRAAGMANNLPFTGFHTSVDFPLPAGTPVPPGGVFYVATRSVSPGYFRALGIPLKEGRDFTANDDQRNAPCVRIVNETLARLFWRGEDPVGKQLPGTCPKNAPALIVGLVADSKQDSMDSQVLPEVYHPYAQFPFASFLVTFVVRTSSNPTDVAAAVRRAVWEVDHDQPVVQVRTMENVISESMWRQRVSASLLGAFAGIALVLAAVGIYGVFSYSVSQRIHEIGIRMALGASRGDILRMVVGQGLLLTGLGLAAGVVAGLSLTHLLGSLLFGVRPRDPLTFIGLSVLLAVVALLACYFPARRATRVDPMVALRYE